MAQLQGVGLGTPKLTEPNPTTKIINKRRAMKLRKMGAKVKSSLSG